MASEVGCSDGFCFDSVVSCGFLGKFGTSFWCYWLLVEESPCQAGVLSLRNNSTVAQSLYMWDMLSRNVPFLGYFQNSHSLDTILQCQLFACEDWAANGSWIITQSREKLFWWIVVQSMNYFSNIIGHLNSTKALYIRNVVKICYTDFFFVYSFLPKQYGKESICVKCVKFLNKLQNSVIHALELVRWNSVCLF